MDLGGRVAIVTGGGTGIGRATSVRLAKPGAKAVVGNFSRSPSQAAATAEELRSVGSEAVSKAGVVQMTRALALALAPDVRVNSVSPGMVSTRWFSRSLGEDAAAAQEEVFAKATPLRKIATPDDVAQAVITGQDLVIDGGKNVLYQPLG